MIWIYYYKEKWVFTTEKQRKCRNPSNNLYLLMKNSKILAIGCSVSYFKSSSKRNNTNIRSSDYMSEDYSVSMFRESLSILIRYFNGIFYFHATTLNIIILSNSEYRFYRFLIPFVCLTNCLYPKVVRNAN